MEEIDDILYDDVEAKYLALQNKKKNRKKRRRKRRFLILIFVLVFGFLYFSNDVSKVKSLEVSGNTYYSKEAVLQKAGLSYNTRYILIPKFYLEWKLKQDELIDDVHVSKEINGTISIKVEEKLMVGYVEENNKYYIVLSDGTKKQVDDENKTSLVNFPFLDSFDKTQLKKLANSFGGKTPVDEQVIAMMSEIVPYTTGYDKHMAKITMQDGNTIFTSYESISLMNNYLDAIKKLNKTHACLWPDINTGSIQSLDCSTKE